MTGAGGCRPRDTGEEGRSAAPAAATREDKASALCAGPSGRPRSGGRNAQNHGAMATGGWAAVSGARGGDQTRRTLDLSGQSMLASPAWIRRLCSANSRSLLAPFAELTPFIASDQFKLVPPGI